jgi:hypothetical protein
MVSGFVETSVTKRPTLGAWHAIVTTPSKILSVDFLQYVSLA